MSISCPRCHQSVDTQAIACPYCRTLLKAHGHPGIPLHRASGETFLCDSCRYDQDDTCTFPQRPYAKECTLYRNQAVVAQPLSVPSRRPWWQRPSVWLIVLGAIALLLTIF